MTILIAAQVHTSYRILNEYGFTDYLKVPCEALLIGETL